MFRFCFLFCAIALSAPLAADVSGTLRVVDGDTFEVSGEKVRLFGIDAPEHAQTCVTEQGARWACGAWVTAQTALKFEGKRAHCREMDRDRYERIVARCDVEGRDVAQELVSDGLAFAYRKYSKHYLLAENRAAVLDKGLHASRVQSPAQFRATRAKGRIPPDRTCVIKGNITKNGHIFHEPGQRDYERTGINLAKGERWFCSRRQARAAGWRQARR